MPARDKHSSLFAWSVNNGEKNLIADSKCYKTFFSQLTAEINNIEAFVPVETLFDLVLYLQKVEHHVPSRALLGFAQMLDSPISRAWPRGGSNS